MTNYYSGTAITIGGEITIRVKPENIQDDEVKELEMPLSHQVDFAGGRTFGKPIMEKIWTTLVSGRPNQSPVVYGSAVQLNINREIKVFRFNQSGR